jgi:hypothetical protein
MRNATRRGIGMEESSALPLPDDDRLPAAIGAVTKNVF